MSKPKVVLITTGSANIASVIAAFKRCGRECILSENREEIAEAQFVVLPGVGSFKSAMKSLVENNIVEPLCQRIKDGKPTLAICLGMQLLAESSEESPGIKGLGIIEKRIVRLGRQLTVPQIGWNSLEPETENSLVKSGFAYFANSFVLPDINSDWKATYATYGNRFVAAIEKKGLLACQFHPELSGQWGHELLLSWLEKGELSC